MQATFSAWVEICDSAGTAETTVNKPLPPHIGVTTGVGAVLARVSVALTEHQGQKQPGGARVRLHFQVTFYH